MKSVFMVGNTHFDPVWLWHWGEAMSSILATFRSALERMEEYPEFKYSFSAPAVFEWIKNTDYDLFLRIKKRIDEGRWELCEGWWLQADCNAALGESYVRQGLYAQRYFMENFGKKSKTVFNIDSFGHSASLPQILSGCGIENYVFWRPNQAHMHIDSPLFRWNGENGSRVNAYRLGGKGGEVFTADIDSDSLTPLIESLEEEPFGRMLVYGVTDHGGAPTKEMIEKILRKRESEKVSTEINFATVEEFFESADMSSAPELKGEFQVKFPGPYSNYTDIKKNNRRAEYAVMNAERAAVIAEKLLGKPYPTKKLENCWKDVMFNQFHDILGGCCIKDAYFDARNLHGRAMQTSEEITYFSLQAITNNIKMPGKNPDNAWNLVVWNLNGADFEDEIEVEVQWAWEFDWYDGGIELYDSDGKKYACQPIKELSVIPKFRSRFVFKAKIPALGYKCFIVKQTGSCEKKTCNTVESSRFFIQYNEHGIQSVYDKIKNKDVISKLLIPYVVEDSCDTWGFNKDTYETDIQFMKLNNCEITESGEILTTVRLEWEYNKSGFEQEISIYGTHIDCKYRALWREEGKVLKLMLSNGDEMCCKASTPYGEIERAASVYEKPMCEWVTIYNDTDSITVLTDSIFAYNFDGKALGLTVLRNCIFGDLRTEPLNKARKYSYMGQGETEGKIRIAFEGNATVMGNLFANPPIVMCEANHDGRFLPSDTFAAIPKDTLLGALKKSENEDSYIIRLYNTTANNICGSISLFDIKASTMLKPYEVQTLSADENGFKTVNMLEEEL